VPHLVPHWLLLALALAAGVVLALLAGSAHLSGWLIGALVVLSAFFVVVALPAALGARRIAVRTGVASLMGSSGVAESDLAPSGKVRVEGEVWSAECDEEPIHRGDRVLVVGATGVTLRVTRAL
jgi:membrane-bound serine protease (ClpP class)